MSPMHSKTVRPSVKRRFCNSPEEGLLVFTSTKMPFSYRLQSLTNGTIPSDPRYPFTVSISEGNACAFAPFISVKPR